jgi:hypothetical protein
MCTRCVVPFWQLWGPGVLGPGTPAAPSDDCQNGATGADGRRGVLSPVVTINLFGSATIANEDDQFTRSEGVPDDWGVMGDSAAGCARAILETGGSSAPGHSWVWQCDSILHVTTEDAREAARQQMDALVSSVGTTGADCGASPR